MVIRLKTCKLLVAILIMALGLVAGAHAGQAASLYQRLGGQQAITAVVAEFVANVAADPRIKARFAETDIPHLKAMLVEQICAGSGGPCVYSGRDMKTTHRGMHIQEAEFSALVEDLVRALDKFQVPSQEKTDLLNILSPMKGDIVNQ